MQQRPTGITILALVYILLAILSLLWSLFVFGFGGVTATFGTLFGARTWPPAASTAWSAARWGSSPLLSSWSWPSAVEAAAVGLAAGHHRRRPERGRRRAGHVQRRAVDFLLRPVRPAHPRCDPGLPVQARGQTGFWPLVAGRRLTARARSHAMMTGAMNETLRCTCLCAWRKHRVNCPVVDSPRPAAERQSGPGGRAGGGRAGRACLRARPGPAGLALCGRQAAGLSVRRPAQPGRRPAPARQPVDRAPGRAGRGVGPACCARPAQTPSLPRGT